MKSAVFFTSMLVLIASSYTFAGQARESANSKWKMRWEDSRFTNAVLAAALSSRYSNCTSPNLVDSLSPSVYLQSTGHQSRDSIDFSSYSVFVLNRSAWESNMWISTSGMPIIRMQPIVVGASDACSTADAREGTAYTETLFTFDSVDHSLLRQVRQVTRLCGNSEQTIQDFTCYVSSPEPLASEVVSDIWSAKQ
jgi:hypothetical protein